MHVDMLTLGENVLGKCHEPYLLANTYAPRLVPAVQSRLMRSDMDNIGRRDGMSSTALIDDHETAVGVHRLGDPDQLATTGDHGPDLLTDRPAAAQIGLPQT